MDRKKKNDDSKKFCVVEFLELPYRDIKKFVIVPRSWVTNKTSPDSRVDVAYPREKSAKTQNRCEKNERPKGDWKKYLARKKFENHNYAAANQWIVQNANESTNNGIIERGNAGNQSATTIDSNAHSSCHNAKLNGKSPVKGPLVGNDRNTQMESPRPSTLSSSAITHEKLEIARATISAIEKLPPLNNSVENLGTENLPLTPGNNLSRGYEIVTQCTIKRQDFSQSNGRNTTTVPSTSSYHSRQPVESQNDEHLLILSEGISHNHCGHQELVPKRSIEKNSNDQRTQTMTPVTQTPIHQIQQQSPILENIFKNSFLTINGNHTRQELREGERPDKPTEGNEIGQRPDPQDVTENTPSAMSMSTDSEYRRRMIGECTQKQHSPAREENSPQNPDQSKLVTTGPLELKFVVNDKQHQVIKENALIAMQNVSNVAHQLSRIIEHSHNQWQPVYEASIQNDVPVNNMFRLGSTGASSDQKVPCPSFMKNTPYFEQSIPSAVQYPSNLVAHTFCSPECSQRKRYSSFIPSYPFQDIRYNDPLIPGFTGGNSISRQMVDSINGVNSTRQSRDFKTTTEKISIPNHNSLHAFNVLEADSGFRTNEPLTSSSRDVTETLNEQRTIGNALTNHYDIYNHESYEPPKKKSHQEFVTIVLPPKGNSMRLKMTLKHQKASPEVIEVLPRSSIYIDARKFVQCRYKATSYSRLARMLLVEIFSEHALRECTLSGGKNTRYSASHKLRGLDEHAKNVLLTFVEEYGRQKGWGVYNEGSVLKSLSNKLLEIKENVTNPLPARL